MGGSPEFATVSIMGQVPWLLWASLSSALRLPLTTLNTQMPEHLLLQQQTQTGEAPLPGSLSGGARGRINT